MADFKKIIKPRKEFIRETKTRFLAVFDVAHPGHAHARASHGIKFILRIVAASAALVAVLLGSVSAYADSTNVAPGSGLYTFKRLSEDVRLALAAPQAKPELQATFAARRADEIQEVAATNPTSTLVAKLSNDLNTDVDDSVTAAHASQLATSDLDAVCGKILGAIATSSVALHGDAPITSRAFLRFENVCAENPPVLATTATPTSGGGSTTPSTSISSTVAPSTAATMFAPATTSGVAATGTIATGTASSSGENKNEHEHEHETSTRHFAAPIRMRQMPTSTPTVTPALISAPTAPTSTELRIRGGGFLRVLFNQSSSTASGTIVLPDFRNNDNN